MLPSSCSVVFKHFTLIPPRFLSSSSSLYLLLHLDSAVTFLQKKILESFFDISFINLILLSGFLFNKQKY